VSRAPKVGVGVFVQRRGAILLGLRKRSHGAGTWSIPGGLIEEDETVEEAAKRELHEETGIVPTSMRVLPAPAWLRFYSKPGGTQGYVTLYAHAFVAEDTSAMLREPEKCAEWRWINTSFVDQDWPGKLFASLQDLFDEVDVTRPQHLLRFLVESKYKVS